MDAGFAGQASRLFDAIRQPGRTPRNLRHLVFTRGHPNPIGSAAAIIRETGAITGMHPAVAPLAEISARFRPMNPAPGLLPRTAPAASWRGSGRASGCRSPAMPA